MSARASFSAVGILIGTIIALSGIIAPLRYVPTLEATALACDVIALARAIYADLKRR